MLVRARGPAINRWRCSRASVRSCAPTINGTGVVSLGDVGTSRLRSQRSVAGARRCAAVGPEGCRAGTRARDVAASREEGQLHPTPRRDPHRARIVRDDVLAAARWSRVRALDAERSDLRRGIAKLATSRRRFLAIAVDAPIPTLAAELHAESRTRDDTVLHQLLRSTARAESRSEATSRVMEFLSPSVDGCRDEPADLARPRPASRVDRQRRIAQCTPSTTR